MGVTNYDQMLLSILQKLKDSPIYWLKAVPYWLREIEMEKYDIVLAKKFFYFDLETLSTIEDDLIDKLIDIPLDREKMKMGIKELKEFQMYYSYTSVLLHELGMEKYIQLFALHGISIDILPFLTEAQLIQMGITDRADRKVILLATQKIRDDLPETATPSWFNSNQKKSKKIDTTTFQPNGDDRSLEDLLNYIDHGTVSSPNNNLQSTKQKRKKRRKGNKKLIQINNPSTQIKELLLQVKSQKQIKEHNKLQTQKKFQCQTLQMIPPRRVKKIMKKLMIQIIHYKKIIIVKMKQFPLTIKKLSKKLPKQISNYVKQII